MIRLSITKGGGTMEATKRKTDRRTLYTRQVVKDALLELLAEHHFEDINVTMLCRQAEITRATFYLHFDGLSAVVDELLEEALSTAQRTGRPPEGSLIEFMDQLGERDDPSLLMEHYDQLPTCLRAADDPKYQPLFMDDLLSNVVIRKIYLTERDNMVPIWRDYCGLSEEQARIMFQYTIHGSYMVNKAFHFQRTEEWCHMTCTLLAYSAGGYKALRRRAGK